MQRFVLVLALLSLLAPMAPLSVLALLAPAAHAQTGDEVPFITTPDNVTRAMLELAGVGPRDRVLDLGSGDGRIVITAAQRFGARGVGVEIVPDLVARSRMNAERAGVADRARFVEQDLFATDLSQASVITMYLLPEVNLQLRPKLLALAPGTRIVSHDWDLGDWRPDRTWIVDAPEKSIGREKLSRLHHWVVPAHVEGWWCAAGASMKVEQSYQFVVATVQQGAHRSSWTGRLNGATLHLMGDGSRRATGRVDGAMLHLRATKLPQRWQHHGEAACAAAREASR